MKAPFDLAAARLSQQAYDLWPGGTSRVRRRADGSSGREKEGCPVCGAELAGLDPGLAFVSPALVEFVPDLAFDEVVQHFVGELWI